MSTRRVPLNWIKGWQYWLKESEAPDSYILWSAISAVAGCTQRRVYAKWGYHRYYTNHYIILVGPAGIVHKSSTIDMVRRVLREIGAPTASEALTKEELIRQMISRGDGIVSALTALPDELSDFIRPSGPAMIEFLTSIYGSPEVWQYSTRARGTEEITKAFLNLLGGTTPRWIANEFDVTFVEQGFASRTLFVHELEPRFRKADMRITHEMEKMYEYLVQDLLHISSLEGEFVWDDDARDWFNTWYEQELPKELQAIDYRLQSYIARKPTHLLKLSMVLQLMNTDELVISKINMLDAKRMLDDLEQSMARTFSAVGRNIYANDLERIAQEIRVAGHMSKSELIRRNYSAFATQQSFDDTMQMLCDMGYVRKGLIGGDIEYVPGPMYEAE